MGGRHLLGLRELYNSTLCNIELVAVCDLRKDNARHLADDAERILNCRPTVFTGLDQMVTAMPELQAVDITTDVGAHHIVACAALDLGLNVLCEKPLALTVRGCNRIIEAQRRSGKVLSVAENYRRDPMSRLTKALLDVGVIGSPYLYLDVSASSGNQMVITPWRHKKHMGGMLLDGGVHNADMMHFYLGGVTQVYAKIALWERTRFKSNRKGGVAAFYGRWYDEMPQTVEATAEDTLTSVISFESGTMGQWTQCYAGHGHGFGHKAIYGALGSLRPGGTRNGASPIVRSDGDQEIEGNALLELVPGWRLDAITAAVFGADRLACYSMPFPEADRKLLAIEFHEFGECILTGKQPEVDGSIGRQDVALCYAAFESSVLNRPVTLQEIESETTGTYESEINEHWSI
jgi:predicted dehydrogenase